MSYKNLKKKVVEMHVTISGLSNKLAHLEEIHALYDQRRQLVMHGGKIADLEYKLIDLEYKLQALSKYLGVRHQSLEVTGRYEAVIDEQ